jgi:hypothetical protein
MRRRRSARFGSLLILLSAIFFMAPAPAHAAGSDPKPIPGGFVPFPGAPLIHVFAPGPVDAGFMGENVEPSTITDFKGITALSYPLGTATDGDGNTFVMFNDMRVFTGTYVSMDGSILHGTFAFI